MNSIFACCRIRGRLLVMKLMGLLKKILILQVPVVLVALVGWSLRTETEFFIIRDIPVDVEFESHQKSLVESLRPDMNQKLLALKGANIWSVSLKDVRDQLLDNPWIKEVEIQRSFPNKIYALVRLTPVAFLYLDPKNRIFPISEEGVRLDAVKASVVPVAPILRNNKIIKDPQLTKKIIKMLREVPNLGALRKENIASVDYKLVTGLTLRLVEGDEVVHLGEKDISTKGLRVLRVTDYLKSQKQKARVIDASFTKKVLVRPRKRS